MGNLFNIEGYGKRFGAMPLPIEDSNSAAEGELMVSRTTGHMYVRNGSRNVSKTVELEEFLRAFRVSCINGIRNSGEYFPDLAKSDWKMSYATNEESRRVEPIFELDAETNKHVMVFNTHGTDVQWQYISNPIGTYNRLRYKKGQTVCFSICCKTDTPMDLTVLFQDGNSLNNKLSFQTIRTTTELKKYELTTTLNKDVVFDESTVVYLNVGNQKGIKITIEYCQIETGDRSSSWRPSWLDYYQRMDFLGSGIKEWVKERIVEAINQCKNYTDSSITNLSNNVKRWIQSAIEQSKEYTNQEITKVNNRIDNEKQDLIQRDTLQTVHLNLGNQDYIKYLSTSSNLNENIKPEVVYDNAKGGLIFTGENWVILKFPIPIDKDSKYILRLAGEQLVGDGRTYSGAVSLDSEFRPLFTDSVNNYQYCVYGGEIITQNSKIEKQGIISGYNVPVSEGTGTVNKFDPNASYFYFMFLLNHQCPETNKTLITSIEVFEVPRCLWNALDVATSTKDGLMAKRDKEKLDTVAWNANNYSHPTGDGNLHVPATGRDNNGKVLTAGPNPGDLIWKTPSTDADTLDGMDSSEFIKFKDTKPSGFSVMRKYTDVFQYVVSAASLNNKYVKIKTPLLLRGKYVNVQMTLNADSKSESFISISAFGSRTTLGVDRGTIGAFSTNKKYGDNIYIIQDENTHTMDIYLEKFNTDSDLVLRVLNAYSAWDNYEDGLKFDWSVSFVDSLPNEVVTIKVNESLNSAYLNGKPESFFAKRLGKQYNSYKDNISSYEDANINLLPNNGDSWVILDRTANLSDSKYGLYFRNNDSPLVISGEETLEANSFAFIGGNKLQHYLALNSGNVYHKGNLKSKNVDLGPFSLKYDPEEQCLDFIVE